jgi:hypothetical protein
VLFGKLNSKQTMNFHPWCIPGPSPIISSVCAVVTVKAQVIRRDRIKDDEESIGRPWGRHRPRVLAALLDPIAFSRRRRQGDQD